LSPRKRGSRRVHASSDTKDPMRGNMHIISWMAVIALATAGTAAPSKLSKPTQPVSAAKSLVQNCDAHRFETTIHVTGADGQPKQSTVRMCGTEGQSDADWIRTLRDAVRKTSLNVQMPQAAREQIVAAVNAEIMRLMAPPSLAAGGADIAHLPKAAPTPSEVPLTRDYGALPPLPTAAVAPPHMLGPGGLIGPVPRLTLRCALAGDEDRPSDCDTLDRDTVMVVRADEAFPGGIAMRFLRHGDSRAELDLPAMQPGQTAKLRLPAAVCAGVVRSRVEVQALGGNAPSGTPAGTVGEYDLRC
jgi:hypothetical protein